MKYKQAYDRYLIKTEKNGTNDNISTNHGMFVKIYNEAQNKYYEWLLDRKSEDDVRYIQKTLIQDKKINAGQTKTDFNTFPLPNDYFDFGSTWAKASTEKCKGVEIELFEMKTENKNEVLQDEFQKPSFKYREAPFTISSDAIQVYKDDFDVPSIYLSYYRYPKQMSLVNNSDPESPFLDEETEFDDKLTDRIISLCAKEFDLNSENSRVQLQQQRVTQKV